MNRYNSMIEGLKGEFVYARSGESPRHISDAEIQDFEQRIHYRLPDDYRQFIRDFGGFSFYSVAPSSMQDHIDLDTFYGLNLGATLDLSRMREISLSAGVITPEILPIARDAADNNFLLFLDGEHKGSVYFLPMDESTIPFNYVEDYRLSSSFDEFMQSLQLLPQE